MSNNEVQKSEDVEKARIILNELIRTNKSLPDLCKIYNFNEDEVMQIIDNDTELRKQFDENLSIQRKLQTQELLYDAMNQLQKLVNDENYEVKENYKVNENGETVKTGETRTKKPVDYRAVEKILSNYASYRFGSGFKSDQLFQIFMSFNQFLTEEYSMYDVVEKIIDAEKIFIQKISSD